MERIATLAELRSGIWTALDVEAAHAALDYKAAVEALAHKEGERRAAAAGESR